MIFLNPEPKIAVLLLKASCFLKQDQTGDNSKFLGQYMQRLLRTAVHEQRLFSEFVCIYIL